MEPIEKLLKNHGLDWRVRSESIKTETDIIIPKKIAILRNDTNHVLGVHGDGYEPYQNHEFLELLFQISRNSGLELKNGGYFKNGEKVWFQLKSNDLILPNDRIEGFITGINSFDGSTSLGFGNTTITISCLNTFWRGYKQLGTKVKHTSTMRPKIDEILRKIDTLIEEEQEFYTHIQKLGNVKISKEVKEMVIRKILDIKKEERLDGDDLSTYKKNKLETFNSDFNKEIIHKGNNLWGLFSAVTRYTTHSMKNGDNTESKAFGIAGEREREIWGHLVHAEI